MNVNQILDGDLSEVATNVTIDIRPASGRTLKSLQSGKLGAVDPKLVKRLIAHEKEILEALQDPTFAAQFMLDPIGAIGLKLKNDELLSELRTARTKRRPADAPVVHMQEMTIRVERRAE